MEEIQIKLLKEKIERLEQICEMKFNTIERLTLLRDQIAENNLKLMFIKIALINKGDDETLNPFSPIGIVDDITKAEAPLITCRKCNEVKSVIAKTNNETKKICYECAYKLIDEYDSDQDIC